MIRVSYTSEILGSGTFWEGEDNSVKEIRNISARKLAKKVVMDGETRELGMWKVEKVK